jgi:hypothetical protein
VSPKPSAALTVKLDVPLPVGVPLMVPLEPLSVSPVGNEPLEIE